jgi:Patatin-like phospholipase
LHCSGVEMAEGRDDQDHVFELGLSLAGAISAGAYTAGVIDFLVQALSEWDRHRGEPGVAGHRVVLKVVAGASAGAIAGALGVIALARGLKPREFTPEQIANRYPDRYPTHQKYECVLPPLHQTLVKLPAMVRAADGAGGFFGTGDITGETADGARMVRSLLNASLLDEIKRAAIDPPDGTEKAPAPPPVSFVANRLHVYMTLSNMRGIPFEVAFGRSSYGMQTVGDRVHYVIGDLGTQELKECDWLAEDSKASLPLSVMTLPRLRGAAKTSAQMPAQAAEPVGATKAGPPPDPLGSPSVDWDMYGTTALASGAFPIGLASRELRFAMAQYMDRRYPFDLPDRVIVRPKFPPSATKSDTFAFACIDGGLVNNNPFDYAQFALTGARHIKPTDGNTASQAIVMVAPFPEPPAFPPEGTPSSRVVSILKALLPALLNQARFRASDLTPAMNDKDFSRFVIAPLRRIPRTKPPKKSDEDARLELYPIACGLLGGFGGFLHEEFRAHDFQLGRRNCQQFLCNFFWVPPDNAIVDGPVVNERKAIIPLLGDAADTVPMPRWPKMSVPEFERVCGRMKARIDAVVPQLIRDEAASVKQWLALRFGWRVFLRRRVFDFLCATMLVELVRHRQIEDWDASPLLAGTLAAHKNRSPDDVQAVIAELMSPASVFRTPDEVATATHLPPIFVAAVLNALLKNGMPPRVRTWTDGEAYSLYSRCSWYVKIAAIVRTFFRS